MSDTLPVGQCPSSDDVMRQLLPSEEDSKLLHENFETHVARILVNNMPFMKLTFDDVVDWHILHRHSQQMWQKSEVVSRS